jgi:hypothetical protein
VSRQVVYRVEDDPAKAEAMLAEWDCSWRYTHRGCEVRGAVDKPFNATGGLTNKAETASGERQPKPSAMPEKHHYIPVFYLKRWADKDGDGRLCVYSRPYDRVKVNRKHPDATGYEYDLNAIRGADAETEGHLEGRFFLRADNDAARALDILQTGRCDLMDASVRSAWSRFLMTLLHRNPERVAEWKSRGLCHGNGSASRFAGYDGR